MSEKECRGLLSVFRRRVKILKLQVPVWVLLFLAVTGVTATVLVTMPWAEESAITIESVDLIYTSRDVTVSVTDNIVSIQIATYATANWDSDDAYSIKNLMGDGSHVIYEIQGITGDMSGITTFDAWIGDAGAGRGASEAINFLSWDGSAWTTRDYGLANGVEAFVQIHVDTDAAVGPISFRVDYKIQPIATKEDLAVRQIDDLAGDDTGPYLVITASFPGSALPWACDETTYQLPESFTILGAEWYYNDPANPHYYGTGPTSGQNTIYAGEMNRQSFWDSTEAPQGFNPPASWFMTIDTDLGPIAIDHTMSLPAQFP